MLIYQLNILMTKNIVQHDVNVVSAVAMSTTLQGASKASTTFSAKKKVKAIL